LMIAVSIIPVLQRTGEFYILPATAVLIFSLGLGMLYFAVKLLNEPSNFVARKLMLASVLYITVVQIIYVIDRFLH
jgi:protoheme IX farnesyltransferase